MKRLITLVIVMIACGDGGQVSNDTGPEVGTKCVTVEDCRALSAGPCEQVSCEDATCVVIPAREGEVCEPNDLCAIGPKRCHAGVCEYSTMKECPELPCRRSAGCNPLTGECMYEPMIDGSSCDLDRNPCTKDVCSSGKCVAGPNDCTCANDQDCPKNNDLCAPLVCDQQSSRCIVDKLVECEAPKDECSPNQCNPDTGKCEVKKLPNGTPCEVDNPCNLNAVCVDGKCEGDFPCDDNDDCTADQCDQTDGGCIHEALTGTTCNDHNQCTEPDVCDKGTCVGTPLDCDDKNPCTEDSCDHEHGCVHKIVVGQPCVLDVCTVNATCGKDGKCQGEPKTCNDNNPCTADSCDPKAGGCVFEAIEGDCDDQDICTIEDRCIDKKCVGKRLPLCCNQDQDCSDDDPCTVESCEGHLCVYKGEPTYTCDKGSQCLTGFCTDKGCAIMDTSMPARLLDWDFTSGIKPKGMRWSPNKEGSIDTGLGLHGQQGASFVLPERFAPAGVKVLYLYASECEGISVEVPGKALVQGCGMEGGDKVMAIAWQDEVSSKLNVTVSINQFVTVRRLMLYQWANKECKPLQPAILKTGTSFSDLSVSGTSSKVLVAARNVSKSIVSTFEIGVGAMGMTTLDKESYSSIPDRFTTSFVRIPNGGHLLAYGGADKTIRLVQISDSDEVVASASLVASPGEEHYWPHLFTFGESVFIVWSSNYADKNGLGLFVAKLLTSEGMLGEVVDRYVINSNAPGDQYGATVCPGVLDLGIVAWVSETEASSSIVARALNQVGAPAGSNDTVVISSTQKHFSHLSAAGVDDRCLIVWQTDDGNIGGTWLTKELVISDLLYFKNDLATFRGSPSLLSSGPILVYVRTDASGTNVVQSFVQSDGAVELPVKLSGQVHAPTASPVISPAGPFIAAVAYTDTESPIKGIRIVLTGCATGTVSCSGIPSVCIGFGPTGLISLPGATWCN